MSMTLTEGTVFSCRYPKHGDYRAALKNPALFVERKNCKVYKVRDSNMVTVETSAGYRNFILDKMRPA